MRSTPQVAAIDTSILSLSLFSLLFPCLRSSLSVNIAGVSDSPLLFAALPDLLPSLTVVPFVQIAYACATLRSHYTWLLLAIVVDALNLKQIGGSGLDESIQESLF